MSDVVVTVPKGLWEAWIEEGDVPGEVARYRSHFWIGQHSIPDVRRGERVYIVAHGKLRGYAPLVGIEQRCTLRDGRACLMRDGGAVAVTIPEPIVGFMGWRCRWWSTTNEKPFPNWREI